MNINAIYTIAKKEFFLNCKNTWIIIVAVLLTLMDYSIIHFNVSFSGGREYINSNSILTTLVHLQMYLIPLFSLILSYDGILKEKELGTLNLLLTYPLKSSDIVLGKWLGYALTLSLTIILSFMLPIYVLSTLNISILSMLYILTISIFLGLIFLSLGLFTSTFSNNRSFVSAISIILYLFYVFLFDLLFVLVVISLNGIVLPSTLNYILLFSLPSGTEEFYGIGSGVLQFTYCFIAMMIWIIIPLMITMRKNFYSIKGKGKL